MAHAPFRTAENVSSFFHKLVKGAEHAVTHTVKDIAGAVEKTGKILQKGTNRVVIPLLEKGLAARLGLPANTFDTTTPNYPDIPSSSSSPQDITVNVNTADAGPTDYTSGTYALASVLGHRVGAHVATTTSQAMIEGSLRVLQRLARPDMIRKLRRVFPGISAKFGIYGKIVSAASTLIPGAYYFSSKYSPWGPGARLRRMQAAQVMPGDLFASGKRNQLFSKTTPYALGVKARAQRAGFDVRSMRARSAAAVRKSASSSSGSLSKGPSRRRVFPATVGKVAVLKPRRATIAGGAARSASPKMPQIVPLSSLPTRRRMPGRAPQRAGTLPNPSSPGASPGLGAALFHNVLVPWAQWYVRQSILKSGRGLRRGSQSAVRVNVPAPRVARFGSVSRKRKKRSAAKRTKRKTRARSRRARTTGAKTLSSLWFHS